MNGKRTEDSGQRTEEELRAALREAALLVGCIVDKVPCDYDRHGNCDAHAFVRPCPHDLARTFIAEWGPEKSATEGAENTEGGQ